MSFSPRPLRHIITVGEDMYMRSMDLDRHRYLGEVKIKGGVGAGGGMKINTGEVELYPLSLTLTDKEEVEPSGSAPGIGLARLPHPRRGRVVIASKLKALAVAEAKTNKVEVRTVALRAAGGHLLMGMASDERCGGGGAGSARAPPRSGWAAGRGKG